MMMVRAWLTGSSAGGRDSSSARVLGSATVMVLATSHGGSAPGQTSCCAIATACVARGSGYGTTAGRHGRHDPAMTQLCRNEEDSVATGFKMVFLPPQRD